MEFEKWYLNAKYKFVWDIPTILEYTQVLQQILYVLISEFEHTSEQLQSLTSPDLGIFSVIDEQNLNGPPIGCALYISNARYKHDERLSLFAAFKSTYKMLMGGDSMAKHLMFNEKFKTVVESRAKSKLIKNFDSLANKSLNRRRAISPRIRYMVLERDKFTCQKCGRKAPEVRLHVDHIIPVSWGQQMNMSNNLDEYQTLCEDCNLGKGNMSWLFTS